MNVYDIALDFMLMDAFSDLESPPSALTTVINNGWISDGIKQGVCEHTRRAVAPLTLTLALPSSFPPFLSPSISLIQQLLNTAVWSILKAKMSLLKVK